ncbi:ABC transporter permease [Streptomyces sp. NPDC057367]|uniref:ABC transporter permease n=1 Tax=Streptomyces sp. NPDC057367 TaxID=3346108 RepID=UPI00362A5A71
MSSPRGGAVTTLVESARTQFLLARRYPMMIVLNIVQPLAFLLIVMQRLPGDDSARLGELVIAVLLTCYWGSVIWSAGGILRRDRLFGTLSRSLLNARDGVLVIVGRCLGTMVASLITLVLTAAVMVLASDRPIELPGAGWLVAGFIGVAVSGTSLGLLLACALLHTRHGVVITGALMYPVFVFGGLLVPDEAVPDALEWVSVLVSLSWARDFMVSGDWLAGVGLVATTVAYFAGGVWAYRRTLHVARREGTLDLV